MRTLLFTVSFLVCLLLLLIKFSGPTAQLTNKDAEVGTLKLGFIGVTTYHNLNSKEKIHETLKSTTLPNLILFIDKVPAIQNNFEQLNTIPKGTEIKMLGVFLTYTPSKFDIFSTPGLMQLVQINGEKVWMDTANISIVKHFQ